MGNYGILWIAANWLSQRPAKDPNESFEYLQPIVPLFVGSCSTYVCRCSDAKISVVDIWIPTLSLFKRNCATVLNPLIYGMILIFTENKKILY